MLIVSSFEALSATLQAEATGPREISVSGMLCSQSPIGALSEERRARSVFLHSGSGFGGEATLDP